MQLARASHRGSRATDILKYSRSADDLADSQRAIYASIIGGGVVFVGKACVVVYSGGKQTETRSNPRYSYPRPRPPRERSFDRGGSHRPGRAGMGEASDSIVAETAHSFVDCLNQVRPPRIPC